MFWGSISSLITNFFHLKRVSVSEKQLKDTVVCICLLPSPSSLYLRCYRPMNLRDQVLRQGRDLNLGASRPRRRQHCNSKQTSYWGLDARFFNRSERSNEELKSKDRIERQPLWGSKVKGSSVLQNISKRMSSLQKGCVYLFYSQVGRDKLSLHELNKSTSVYSQAEGQGSPGRPWNMIIIIKASQRNNFQHGVRIGFLPATS